MTMHISLLDSVFGTCACKGLFDCTLSIDRMGGIVLWLAILFYMFKALSVLCDDYLSPALEAIETKFLHWIGERLEARGKTKEAVELMQNRVHDVAGVTLQAFGSSAPEIITTLIATFVLVSEVGVGLVIGSAIFNLLVVNGMLAYVACKHDGLFIWWYPLLRDGIFYGVAIAELVYFLKDGKVLWWEGAIMVGTYPLYIVYMFFNRKVMNKFDLLSPEDAHRAEQGHSKWGRCPNEHKLHPISAYTIGGCDRCGKTIRTKEVVLECRKCDEPWWLCARCFEVQRKTEVEETRRIKAAEEAEEADMLANGESAEDGEAAEGEKDEENPQEAQAEAEEEANRGKGSRFDPISLWEMGKSLASPKGAPPAAAPTPEAPGETSQNDNDSETAPAEEEPPKNPYPIGTHLVVQAPFGSKQRRRCTVVELDGTSLTVEYRKSYPKQEVLEEKDDRITLEHRFRLFAWLCDDEEPEEDSNEEEFDKRGGEAWPGYMKVMKDPLPWLCKEIPRWCKGKPCGKKMPRDVRRWSLRALTVFIVLVIAFFAYLMVDSGLRIGTILRIPPRMIGLTLLAAGTSATEFLGSLSRGKTEQDEVDVAMEISNSYGCHVFTILVGLGIPWTISGLVRGSPIEFPQNDALLVDIYWMAGAAGALLLVVLVQGFRLTRCAGVVLLVVSFAYFIYLLATGAGRMP